MHLCNLNELLSANSYPGRGIALGRSADGACAVIAYFIMGRSANSRNRIFESTRDGIRTKAWDESAMTDPSLIIYHPVRRTGGCTIVTNGDQTDTIAQALAQGGTFEDALRRRRFEPDGPSWTPRISGLVAPDGSYRLSILKAMEGNPACCCRYFYEYETPLAGVGHFISTYERDGEPLPSFRGEPRPISISAPDARTWAQQLWTSLNGDNKVSLFVEYLSLDSGNRDTVILNKNT